MRLRPLALALATGLVSALAALPAVPVAAAPVTFFSSASQNQSNTINGFFCAFERNVNGDATSASAGSSCGGISGGDTLSSSAASQSNLTTGELKAVAAVSKSTASPASNFVQAFADAAIGDSFRAFSTTGTPFAWGAGNTVRFSLAVDGTIASSAIFSNGSGVELQILAPGKLDAYTRYIQTGDPDALAEYQDGRIAIFAWGLGVVNFSPLNGTILSFPDTLEASFAPDGDFDWVLRLVTSVDKPAGSPNGTASVDFFNTLEATYTGPDGAVTVSASGAFPGTSAEPPGGTAIPLPATLALLIPGVLVAGAIRARRSRGEGGQ